MLPPRIRRLKLDNESLMRRFANWTLIRMVGTAGMPPEIYRFQYFIRGLYVGPSGAILERNDHLLEVNLSLGYPRRAPQCRMLTPVFHPNFDESTVCIGDFWAASEGLDDLVVRIGRMIAYQEYNTKSPLNGIAARWAAQNTRLLPVDARPMAPPLDGEPAAESAGPSPAPVEVAAAPPPVEVTHVPPPSASAALPAVTAPPPVIAAPPPPVSQAGSASAGESDPWDQKIVIS